MGTGRRRKKQVEVYHKGAKLESSGGNVKAVHPTTHPFNKCTLNPHQIPGGVNVLRKF